MRKPRNTVQHLLRLDVDEPAEKILDGYLKSLGEKSKANQWMVAAHIAALPRPELRVAPPRIDRTVPRTVIPAPVVTRYQSDSTRVHGPVAWSDEEPTYAPIEDNA